jgi:hypothetical protein
VEVSDVLRKLNEGEFLDFNIPADLPAPDPVGAFVDTPVRNCCLEISTGRRTTTRAVTMDMRFTHESKQHRNFRWLPYAPGGITMAATGGMDILSGKFTGCWMIAYRVEGRPEPYVAHVGTVDTNQPTSAATNNAVKATWNNFAGGDRIRVLAGFKPSDTFLLNLPRAIGKDSIFVTLGGVSCNPEPLLYAIGLYGQKDDDNHYRIEAVRPIVSAPMAELEHLLLTTDVRRA